MLIMVLQMRGSKDRLLVNIGGVTDNVQKDKIGLTFVFQNQTDVTKIAGSYSFPDASAAIRAAFRFEETPLKAFIYLMPVQGNVTFEYDSTSATLKGTVSGLTYFHANNANDPKIATIITATFKNIQKK